MSDIKLELFENQSEIIQTQSKVILKLLTLLMQHCDIKEYELKEIKDLIDHTASLKAELSL